MSANPSVKGAVGSPASTENTEVRHIDEIFSALMGETPSIAANLSPTRRPIRMESVHI